MHREDDSKYLLYIEPELREKSQDPIDDELTKLVEMSLSKSKTGCANYSSLEDEGSIRLGSSYRGCHRNCDGERSSNRDYLLENGMITNSLAPHYLRYFRAAIPYTDMKKLMELKEFYNK